MAKLYIQEFAVVNFFKKKIQKLIDLKEWACLECKDKIVDCLHENRDIKRLLTYLSFPTIKLTF